MNIYALAVQIEENSEIFEVFSKTSTSPESPNIFNRWKNGFENGNVTAIKNNELEQVSVGSFWNGTNLIFNESGEILEYYDKENCVILLSNNYVFGAVKMSSDQFVRDKYEAAMSGNVIGIDITNIENVELGSLWNGSNFIN